MVERGVRFVQLYHRGWDNHGSLPSNIPKQCGDIDQAQAALITDLEQRGLLEDTLVIWGGEFGRTVYSQGSLKDDYGRAHIVADEPPNRRGVNDQGEHVKLIHKALRRVMSNPKFGLEEAPETYGPLTAEVVRQFKLGPPMILNEALRQTTPDNIVGRKTIKALDKAIKRSNDRELPDFPIPPINPQEFQIVEFNESAPFLIFRKSHDPQEDDLDITKRRPTVSLSAPQQKQLQLAQSMGETLCRSTMKFDQTLEWDSAVRLGGPFRRQRH